MFYSPALSIPGKIAFIKEEWAISYARKNQTVVYDDNFEVIYDFSDE